MHTRHFDTLDSTSLEARRMLAREPIAKPCLIVADEQTGGVGRLARQWSSPAGGFWSTVLWPLARHAVLDGLGLRIGVACTLAVREVVPDSHRTRIMLKWPNDVLAGGRKVLGVLCEVVQGRGDAGRFALIGVGLNANFLPDQLPEALRERATTLLAFVNQPTDRDAWLRVLATRIAEAIEAHASVRDTVSEARILLHGVGHPIRASLADGSIHEGTFDGLTDEGRAIIVTANERLVLPLDGELNLAQRPPSPT